MARRFNWKRIGYGSGALFATLSTAFALGPSSKDRDPETGRIKENETFCQNESDKPRVIIPSQSCQLQIKGNLEKRKRLEDAIQKSRALCKRVKNEKGLPGLTVAVSVNGKVVWKDGFGFADLENNVRMKPEHIIRIASISKSMTMAMLAKLMEEGKIDIDKPIQTYLPNYPEKYLDGEKVTITTRHLLSHLSGIRHYQKKEEITDNTSDPKDDNVEKKDSQTGNDGVSNKKLKKKKSKGEMSLSEYFFKDKFDSVEESLKMFKDDELLHKPGTKYYYSTHAWSVVSAIIEKLTATEFPKYCTRMFNYWGLKNTYIDLHEPIIYDRARYYTRLKDGVIINSPYVDNSYKWAGGGILSNVIDLNQFANILLYSAQTQESSSQVLDENGLPKTPYLKQSTMRKVWTGNPVTARPEVPDNLYGLGFTVMEPLRKCTFCKESNMKLVGHTGGAIGASSVLLIAFPATTDSANCDSLKEDSKEEPVKGVVVSMITNLTSIGLSKTAYEIANNFQELI